MHFQIATDYAIRIVYYLAKHPNELPTAMSIADAMGITYPFFIKVANKLKHSGVINAVQGRNGGYFIDRNASEISLYEIIFAIEGDMEIIRCLQEDNYCSRGPKEECGFCHIFEKLQDDIINSLSNIYISELN